MSAIKDGTVERPIVHIVSYLKWFLITLCQGFIIMLLLDLYYILIGECPHGVAWADKAYSTNLAHQEVPCSNAGVCDPYTGLCNCFDGFDGAACQRSSCANDCSGHGTCVTMADMSIIRGPAYNNSLPGSGSDLGLPYSNWDSESVTMCNCDPGYFEADCSSGKSFSI